MYISTSTIFVHGHIPPASSKYCMQFEWDKKVNTSKSPWLMSRDQVHNGADSSTTEGVIADSTEMLLHASYVPVRMACV